MRYRQLVIFMLAYPLISPAYAQNTCCPNGCVQNAPNQCVTTGPIQNSCGTTFACPGGSSSSSGGPGGVTKGTGGPGAGAVSQCIWYHPTKERLTEVTNKCVNDLIENAIFVGCLFEDDKGRLEDKRTALSCPARQTALAKQCRQRCADFAPESTRVWCPGMNPNDDWHAIFGNISGNEYGSARVDLCGPPLRNGLINIRPVRRPQQRFN